MKYSRDQHQIVYHYADGVCELLGLATAQQLAIRTAMHLALRELAAGYEATAADMATQIQLLRHELEETECSREQAASEQLSTLLATISTSQAPATISANGTHPAEIHCRPIVTEAPAITFVAEAAQEAPARRSRTLRPRQPSRAPATASHFPSRGRRSTTRPWRSPATSTQAKQPGASSTSTTSG